MILEYVVEQNQLFSDFLNNLQLPKNLMSSILSQSLIQVNGQTLPFYKSVIKGDIVTLFLPEETVDTSISHDNIKLNIVYEDAYLLIVNKPAGMPVMVTKSHPNNTLSNALCYYYVQNHIMSKIHLINRLDKDTSGLMAIAKNRYVKYLLSENLKNKIEREYYCIVQGIPLLNHQIINLPIKKESQDSLIRIVHPYGLNAITEYTVIKSFDDCSLLKVLLKTGRTHQIRVHLSHIGHPIIGDKLYHNNPQPTEMMLFSHRIKLIHPITYKLIEINLEIPESFKKLINEKGQSF
jgi:23S rRNA pseudouridine1911/1915/1917 synthase